MLESGTRLIWMSSLLIAITLFTACESAGTGGGQIAEPDPPAFERTFTITGNTTISFDGGTTPLPATFQFWDTDAAVTGTGAAPVSGLVRAGSYVFEAEGTYSPETEAFTLRGKGTVSDLAVEFSVFGFYPNPAIGTSAVGQESPRGMATVASRPAGNPAAALTTYESESIASGEHAEAPLSSTDGATEVPRPTETRKFYEGTWIMHWTTYFTDATGTTESSVPTEYWDEFTAFVICTATQWHPIFSARVSPARRGQENAYEFNNYEPGYIVDVMEETEDSITVIAYSPQETGGRPYGKNRVTRTTDGGIFGFSYSSLQDTDDQNGHGAASIEDARAMQYEYNPMMTGDWGIDKGMVRIN